MEDIRKFRFTKVCGVCHEEITEGIIVLQLRCDHLFCETCLTPWLQDHNTCPMCRETIVRTQSLENSSLPGIPRDFESRESMASFEMDFQNALRTALPPNRRTNRRQRVSPSTIAWANRLRRN